MRVDAGADEEHKVDDPHEPREDGQGDELRVEVAVAASRRGAVGVVIGIRVRVPLGGGAVVAVVVVVVVVAGLAVDDGVGGEHAAGDGGAEPDEEAEGDVGAGVNAALEFSGVANDELADAPDEGYKGLLYTVSGCFVPLF